MWFSDSPTIVVDSNNQVHVVWGDERAAPTHNEYAGYRDLYYKFKNESGWSTDQQITFSNGTAYYPVLYVDILNQLHLIWQDARDGQSEIYYMLYDGDKWTSEHQVTMSSDDSINPTISIDSQGGIHVFWQEITNGLDSNISYKYHHNSEWSDVIQLTSISLSARNPKVAIDSNDSLHLIWVDERHGNRELYYMTGNEDHWNPEQRITNTDNHSESHNIVVDSHDRLHLVWKEKKRTLPKSNIHYMMFNGVNWTFEQQITEDPPTTLPDTQVTAYAKNPSQLAVSSDIYDRIHLSWQDERGQRKEIYYMERIGETWSLDNPVTFDDGSDSIAPSIGVDIHNTIHVVWSDHRHAEQATGNTEIYYTFTSYPLITINTPEVIYNKEKNIIDIIGVKATNNNNSIDVMDPSETQINYYLIYISEGDFTGLSGNMTWIDDNWSITNVSVSTLDAGEYYVRCYFATTQALGMSRPSEHFLIGPLPQTTTSTNPKTITSHTTSTPTTPEFEVYHISSILGILAITIKLLRYRVRK